MGPPSHGPAAAPEPGLAPFLLAARAAAGSRRGADLRGDGGQRDDACSGRRPLRRWVQQFKRYAKGCEDREREVQEELASLSNLAASYHSRLQSYRIDPDSFTDDDEEMYEEGEEVQKASRARRPTHTAQAGQATLAGGEAGAASRRDWRERGLWHLAVRPGLGAGGGEVPGGAAGAPGRRVAGARSPGSVAAGHPAVAPRGGGSSLLTLHLINGRPPQIQHRWSRSGLHHASSVAGTRRGGESCSLDPESPTSIFLNDKRQSRPGSLRALLAEPPLVPPTTPAWAARPEE